MKAYNVRILTIFLAAVTLTTVGCGRAKLKALKKGDAKEFVTTKNTETEIQTEAQSDSDSQPVISWKDKNSDALREELSQIDSSQTTQVVSQEAVFARKIKNLDFRVSNEGEIQISIRIDEKGKYTNNPSLNEQKIVLRKLSDIEKIRFSRTENDVFAGSNGKIKIVAKKENESGLYSAKIQEKNGVAVIALIRINSTLIGIANEITKVSENDLLSELFKAQDARIKTNIVQLYSEVQGQDSKGIALESAANKIKVFAEVPTLNTKFYIKGFMSESSDQPSHAKLFARAISEDNSSTHAVLLNELYSDIGAGSIALQTYTHTKENTYNLIYINDERGLRAIDADILRLSLMYKDTNAQQSKLVVNLKFVDEVTEAVQAEEPAKSQETPEDAKEETEIPKPDDTTPAAEKTEAPAAEAKDPAPKDTATVTDSNNPPAQHKSFYEILPEPDVTVTPKDQSASEGAATNQQNVPAAQQATTVTATEQAPSVVAIPPVNGTSKSESSNSLGTWMSEVVRLFGSSPAKKEEPKKEQTVQQQTQPATALLPHVGKMAKP